MREATQRHRTRHFDLEAMALELRSIDEVDVAGGPSSSIERITHEIPRYLTELADSRMNRVNRHSRASSLVSVSTKFTTNTLNDDARSIDLVLGGQFFRIARDGGRVTDSAPPPYSGLLLFEDTSMPSTPGRAISPSLSQTSDRSSSAQSLGSAYILSADDVDTLVDIGTGYATPRQHSPSRTPETTTRYNRVQGPAMSSSSFVSEGGLSRPQTALIVTEEPPDRHPSYKSGVETLNVVSGSCRPTRTDDGSRFAPLRRRNGVRLPSLDTHIRTALDSLSPTRLLRRRSQSAGAILQLRGLGDDGANFPFTSRRRGVVFRSPSHGQQYTSNFPFEIGEDQEDDINDTTPLPMDDENDISLHYTRIVRSLDREHRKVLQTKDHDMDSLRQRLDEKDHVYRQELRARDFVIEDLQQQLRHAQRQLEESQQLMQTQIEKAIFRTEDLWESRWKDRDYHLRDRMKRMEEDAQQKIQTLERSLSSTGE